MNKLLIACVLMSAALLPVVAESKVQQTPEQIERMRQIRMKQFGGVVRIEGKGHFAILNAQKQVAETEIGEVVQPLSERVRGLRIKVLPASFSLETARSERERSGAGACVFVIDDAKLPMSLIAIEDGWGFVNIAPLRTGNPDEKKFSKRFRKELIRITSIVFSGAKSQYKTSPLQSVTSVADLDSTVGHDYGLDAVIAIGNHAAEVGVDCDKLITYREACQRGIAPAPANESQTNIWNQVHEMPSAPITIKKQK